jgi:hypothetical protein
MFAVRDADAHDVGDAAIGISDEVAISYDADLARFDSRINSAIDGVYNPAMPLLSGIRRALLEAISDGGEHHVQEAYAAAADRLQLTDAERDSKKVNTAASLTTAEGHHLLTRV